MNKKSCLALVAVGLAVVAFADSYYEWRGNVNSNWDTDTLNWLWQGNASAYPKGGDAFFGDDATSKTVTILSTGVVAGKVVVSNTVDYVINGGDANQSANLNRGLQGVTKFEKWGTGKLTMNGFHSFTGDIEVVQGELTTAGASRGDFGNARTSPIGDMRSSRTITVWTNATLSLVQQGLTGAGNSTQNPVAEIVVHGGTLNLCQNFMNTLGNLWLDDATLTYKFGVNADWRSIGLYGEWTRFSGTKPYVLPKYDEALSGLHIGHLRHSKIIVDDITGDANTDVTFQLPIIHINRDYPYGSSGSFGKYGAGTLCIDNQFNTFTVDVSVVEGTVILNKGNANISDTKPNVGSTTTMGNPTFKHKISVEKDTTLVIAASDVQGQLYNRSLIELHINGGTLIQNDWLANGFGPVVFENAKIQWGGQRVWQNYNYTTQGGTVTNVLYQRWPTFGFNGGVTFKGTNVYNLANSGAFYFGANGMADINVEDITKNADVDVTFGMMFVDGCLWAIRDENSFILGTNQAPRKCTWRKVGAGTMKLGNGWSTFTGDVSIHEGTVILANMGAVEAPTAGPLGDMMVADRKITVDNGATLEMPLTDTFGQLAAQAACTLVVSNGIVKMGKNTSNGLPRMYLYDATISYSGVNGGYGTIAFNGPVTFDGTKPYVWEANDAVFWLGWDQDFQIQKVTETSSNLVGKTEFCVKDITGDRNVDATIAVSLRNRQTWWNAQYYKGVTFKSGMIKTGKGTLSLAAEEQYTEPTVVKEGTLLVDGKLNTSELQVESGAFVGGTGTANTIKIASGGGFTARPDQKSGLNAQVVVLPEDGVVRLDVPYVGDISKVNHIIVPVVKSALVTGAKWECTINGEQPPRGFTVYATVRDGVVYGGYAKSGLTVFIR